MWEPFSKREKRAARAGQQEIYQYDVVPLALKEQVIHIWKDTIGAYNPFGGIGAANRIWDSIHNTTAKEAGLPYLGSTGTQDERCKQYLRNATVNETLDMIEISFRIIAMGIREYPRYAEETHATQTPDDAIEDLNHRFQEHAIGYQYMEGALIRTDSQFVHAEVVKPALSLLQTNGFDGPADEFLRAFDHYRHQQFKEAMSEALKAFESTMKAICDARSWPRAANATAQPLIEIIFKNKLIPEELQSHFGGLRSALESGLPTVSNRNSRHGQGPDPIEVPNYFAAYALHLLATNIVFLVEAHKNLK